MENLYNASGALNGWWCPLDCLMHQAHLWEPWIMCWDPSLLNFVDVYFRDISSKWPLIIWKLVSDTLRRSDFVRTWSCAACNWLVFLGYVVSGVCIMVGQEVWAIEDQPTCTVHDRQSFMGWPVATFCSPFIGKFGMLAWCRTDRPTSGTTKDSLGIFLFPFCFPNYLLVGF